MNDSTGLGTSGGSLSDWPHVVQSIRDILTTPIGTRVMRRAYGSNIHNLIDNPINDETILRIISETADALDRWEPRFRMQRLVVEDAQPGSLEITLYGLYFPRGHLGDYTVIEEVNRRIRL